MISDGLNHTAAATRRRFAFCLCLPFSASLPSDSSQRLLLLHNTTDIGTLIGDGTPSSRYSLYTIHTKYSRASLGLTSGRYNLTKGRIAAAHGRFSRIRKVVPMCTPFNTCFLGPTRVQTQTASRYVQQFLHSSRQTVPVLYNGPSLPLKTVPWGDLGPI